MDRYGKNRLKIPLDKKGVMNEHTKVCGIDVHKEFLQVCLLSRSGEYSHHPPSLPPYVWWDSCIKRPCPDREMRPCYY